MERMEGRLHEEMRRLARECPGAFSLYVDGKRLEEIEIAIVREDPAKLADALSQTPAVIRAALERDGSALERVREQSREWCELAVETTPCAILYADDRFRTAGLCRKAVEADPDALALVGLDRQTPELCRIAVEGKPAAIRHVRDDLITEELCLLAVEGDDTCLAFLDMRDRLRKGPDGPIARIYPRLVEAAIRRTPRALLRLPARERTPDLYRLAIESHGKGALELIRREIRGNGAEEAKLGAALGMAGGGP